MDISASPTEQGHGHGEPLPEVPAFTSTHIRSTCECPTRLIFSSPTVTALTDAHSRNRWQQEEGCTYEGRRHHAQTSRRRCHGRWISSVGSRSGSSSLLRPPVTWPWLTLMQCTREHTCDQKTTMSHVSFARARAGIWAHARTPDGRWQM